MSSTQHLLPRQRDVLDIPLNRHLGIVFDGSVDGIAKSHFQSTPELATFDGQLHGGALPEPAQPMRLEFFSLSNLQNVDMRKFVLETN